MTERTAAQPRPLPLPPAVQPARALVWMLHLALPVVALWLLLAQPVTDVVWQHQPSHFWLVLTVAALNVVLGNRMSTAARRHRDPRLFLVPLAFTTCAGFFLLHALATPGILVAHPNAGFDLAPPVGLALASALAVASSLRLRTSAPERTFRRLTLVRAAIGVTLAGWTIVSLVDIPPLNQPPPPRDVAGPLTTVAIVSIALYVVAAARFYLMHRRAPAAVLLSLITAFTLLAEAGRPGHGGPDHRRPAPLRPTDPHRAAPRRRRDGVPPARQGTGGGRHRDAAGRWSGD